VKGEAFFNVEEISQPSISSNTLQETPLKVKFIVHTDNLDVEVVGTQFNVRNRRGDTEVTLNLGKVKLNSNQSAEVCDVDIRDIYEFVYQYHRSQGVKMPYTARLADSLRAGSGRALLTAFPVPVADEAAAGGGYVPHIREIGEEKKACDRSKGHKPRRWVVERTFAWLSKCRGILVRYEKKDGNYLGLIQLAWALLWFRRLHRMGRCDATQNTT
jgi:hypothetical protein